MSIESIKPDHRWLNWKLVKGRKEPVYSNGKKRTKERYNSEFTSDSLLVDYETASTPGANLGFVTGNGIVCIDIDNAITDGEIHPIAQEIIDSCNSYTEYSPSGNGLHILCKGKLPVCGQKLIYDNHDQLEKAGGPTFDLFDGGQYVTYTGKYLEGTPKEINYVQNKTVQKFQSRVKSQDPEDKPAQTEKISKQSVSSATEWEQLQRRAKGKLEKACERIMLQPAKQGLGRGKVLWTEAGQLSEYVKYGLLEKSEVVEKLKTAALEQVDGESLGMEEINRQIKRGFEAGGYPVTLEWLRENDDTTSMAKKAVSPKGTKENSRFINLGNPDREVNLNINWLIKGFLPRSGICGIYGDSFTGKTFIGLDVAFAVATGTDYCGLAVKAPGDVLYVAGEDDGGVSMRAHAYRQHHKIDLAAPLYMLPSPEDMSNPKNVEAFVDEIVACGVSPRLVVLDTLATCFGGGDENSTGDMNKFFDGLRTLRDRLGCCVMFIHHTGHKDKDRARGSSVLYAALDAEYMVKKQPKSDFINVRCTKLKNNSTGKLFDGLFHIEGVQLGYDEDGDPVSYGVAINDGESEMTDFADCVDQIKISGRNQKLAVVIVDEELGVTPEELRGLLRGEGLKQQGAYDVVNKLVAKGALIDAGGVLEVASGVVVPAREDL